MIHLLEHKGVRVFSLAEGNRNVDAFSILFQDRPFVFLNGMKTPEHSRMDAAHELGHLVLHRRHGMLKSGGNAEKEAQVFASSFLMPEESVHAAIPRIATPSLRQLIQLKKYWRVSVAALAYRLRSLGLLSDWYYRAICIEISKCGRTREPEGIERESSQVLTKVFSGLKESGLSRAEVARQLGLYVNDLDALVFGLGVIGAVPGAPAGPSEPEGTKDQAANERRKNLRIV
jgi:Zn-dependent peptidase ImmA (M78 family)